MVLLNFDDTNTPCNGDGDGYPNNYKSNKEGGTATLSIEPSDAIFGHSLRMHLTEGKLYAQFNPYNYVGNGSYPPGPRAFARQYAKRAADWKFNTYDRMRFWIKVPVNGPIHATNGTNPVEFGTYVKHVKNPDHYSDETGGAHYYHQLNWPAVGEWTQVILNMHPDHIRGTSGGVDPGILPHPTKEGFNYFDALARFYIRYPYVSPKSYPADFLLDEIEFFRQPNQENDSQVYSLSATYRQADNRLIVTWNRNMTENHIKHEVRYTFSDIHENGWKTARKAPNGIITPAGDGGYNGMVYDTTTLPLTGHAMIYLAIKPENSDLFTQIVVPLSDQKNRDNDKGRK